MDSSYKNYVGVKLIKAKPMPAEEARMIFEQAH